MPANRNLVPMAAVFELALGLIGALLARAFQLPLRERLAVSPDTLTRGLLATLPMLLGFAASVSIPWAPLVRLRQRVEGLVRELFPHSNWWELAAISLAAGVGEEILFRGALQPLLAQWTSPLAGLLFASLLFGIVHAASTTYFLVATIVGVYLGWLAQYYDDLTAPILTHALYDFVALAWLQTRKPA